MISVIIPCFNSEQYLEETLRSVFLNEVPKQLIVIDDGSTDATADIARKYLPIIQYVRTRNRGVAAARNTGTSLATGEFVLYLDSDDILPKDTLSARLDLLERTGADVAWTAFQSFGEDWAPTKDGSYRSATIPERREDLEIAVATSRIWSPPGAMLFRRSLIDRMNGWRTDLSVVQDVGFLFDAVVAGGRFVALPETGLLYRVHNSSLSRSSRGRFIADCTRFADHVEAHWSGEGALSPARHRALADMWNHIAVSSLVDGLPDFEAARAAYNRHASPRALFEIGRLMRRHLSPEMTARVARTGLALKDRWPRRPRLATA